MDTIGGSAYDDITDLAALICETSMALVSLTDDGLQHCNLSAISGDWRIVGVQLDGRFAIPKPTIASTIPNDRKGSLAAPQNSTTSRSANGGIADIKNVGNT